MMMLKKPSGWTLSSRIRLVIALIFAMLVALLLVNNLYFYKIITESSLNDQRNALAIYLEQIDNSLHSATSALNELADDYSKNVSKFSNINELKKYFATMDMATRLEVKMTSNPFLECIFFSSPGGDIHLTRFNSPIAWADKLALDDYVRATQDYPNAVLEERWQLIEILDTHYLIQVFSLNRVNIGAIVRLDDFVLRFERTSGQNGDRYVFADEGGTVLTAGGLAAANPDARIPAGQAIIRNFNGQYLIIALPVASTPARLCLVKNRADIYSGVDTVQYLLIAFSLIALVVLFVSSIFVNRYIMVPLKRLFRATKEVEQGNLDFQIAETRASLEYRTLISSFNNMIKEIKDLKIASYEEKIEKHKVELKYLQTQLKPHFYLNAINTISSLSLQKKNKEIGKFIMALSQYLRYLFTDNLTLVPLRNELSHAVDYIKLQQIKYPHLIFYLVEVEPEAETYLMPKLMIHTFIENIFKHAFTGEEMLSVFIKAQVFDFMGERMAQITIEDNGEGFSDQQILDKGSDNMENIGIENVRKTLLLTFGRDNLVELANRDEGGARVVIRIPGTGLRDEGDESTGSR
jgi:two-component system, sensor histidine kinase YesM